MAIGDVNAILRAYLIAQPSLTAIVGNRIISPRLYENCELPAISFFTRGGTSSPYIPPLPEPSVQFDCWAEDIDGGVRGPIGARAVYRALYDVLQGIQRQVVTLPSGTYIIWSAIEEVQGQDLVDVDISGYFRTMAFFKFMIKAE